MHNNSFIATVNDFGARLRNILGKDWCTVYDYLGNFSHSKLERVYSVPGCSKNLHKFPLSKLYVGSMKVGMI